MIATNDIVVEADVEPTVPVLRSPTIVQTLSHDLVRAYLDAEEYRYFVDEDGDFIVEFRYVDRIGGALTMFVRLEGTDHSILAVTVESDRRFPPARRSALLELMNTYHRDYRWPKTSLWEDDGALRIDCETQIDLTAGVHERLLHELIDSAFAEGDAFWRWLTRQLRGPEERSSDDDQDEALDGEDGESTPISVVPADRLSGATDVTPEGPPF